MSELALRGGAPVVPDGAHVRWPVLDASDKAAVLGVLERGVLSGPFAPEVRALEAEFASYVEARHCWATNSGTAALHLSVAAAGLGPGDEVITTAYSFVATALSVLHHGAVPVFADIEPETFGLDPAKIEAAITPRTRAIMPVHMHGTPCRIQAIREIAERRGLILLEDCAQAHGASVDGKKVGNFGQSGGFSIQSSKSLSAGEGGLFVTNDDEVALLANRTRMFGEDVRPSDAASYKIERALDGSRAYDSLQMGWMYRSNEMSAALTRSQLRRLEAFNQAARDNAAYLSKRLAELPGIKPPFEKPGEVSTVHKYRVRLDARALGVEAHPRRVRDAMITALRAEGVDAVLWQTKPIPGQKLFQDKIGYGKGFPWSAGAPVDYDLAQYPVTQQVLDDSLILFSHTYPIAPQPRRVVEAYADAFAKVWPRLAEVLAATS